MSSHRGLPPWPSIAQSPCGEFRTATLRTLARASSPGVCHVQGPDAATCTLCPAGTSSLEKPRVTHHLPSQVAAAPRLPAKEPTISHPARAGRWPRRCGSPLPQRPQTTQAQRLRLLKHPPSSLAPSTHCPSPSTPLPGSEFNCFLLPTEGSKLLVTRITSPYKAWPPVPSPVSLPATCPSHAKLCLQLLQGTLSLYTPSCTQQSFCCTPLGGPSSLSEQSQSVGLESSSGIWSALCRALNMHRRAVAG